MKRRMLISIALVFIMLLNCIMPLIPVHANTSDGGIVLNTKLYKALKAELMSKNIQFIYSDTEKSITIAPEVMSQITKLNLNNKGLYDLSGLENFTALTHLELSGNNLSEDSNLGCISNLPLNYLDLSTNKIGDVSEIDGLIKTINSNEGKVILSNQEVKIVAMTQAAPDGTLEVELPKILSKAGYIKEAWIEETTDGPYVSVWPDRVSAEGTKLIVHTDVTGLYKLVIEIEDNPTEAAAAANLNKASDNILFQSEFYIYVVVYGEEETPIHIPDVNMYKEVRRQLTKGLNGIIPNPEGNIEYNGYVPNKNLASYPYSVDYNGEVLYEECTFEEVGDRIYLTVRGESSRKYVIFEGIVYTLDSAGNIDSPYSIDFEQTILYDVNSTGNITTTLGYRLPVEGANETLYKKAYDEPQVFVIKDDTLMNKITSLILNNKQIRDITGLEYFIGLKNDLNVSQNYLTTINPIYKLQENKAIYEAKLQAKYRLHLSEKKDDNLRFYLDRTEKAKKDSESIINSIDSTVETIIKKFDEAAAISQYNENGEPDPHYANKLESKADEIHNLSTDILKLLNNLDESFALTEDYIKTLYDSLAELYKIYNKEYKLLTILSDTLNYLDIEEYEALKDKLKTQEGKEEVIREQVGVFTGLESRFDFTDFEAYMLNVEFGIILGHEDFSVSKVFEILTESYDYYLEKFAEIGLYSEMVNYCTIKRMETSNVADGQCFCEEYLVNRIKEFEYEGIFTGEEFEYELLERIENLDKYIALYTDGISSGDRLFDAYLKYCTDKIPYEDQSNTIEVEKCTGKYYKVSRLGYDIDSIYSYEEIYNKLENRTNDIPGVGTAFPEARVNTEYVYSRLATSLPKDIDIFEFIETNYQSEANNLYLYDEAVTIANRLLNSNVGRYVTLQDLKKLDISYNADLESIEKISELTTLREFYANANYLGNIEDVNWNALKYIRILGLAYNYITDINCLSVLDHIVDLDVSHNLISGKFKFNFEKSQFTLRNLDLSYNQIEDIVSIQEFLDRRTGGNYADYLANNGILYINLNNQNLNIEVKESIDLAEFPHTVNIEMPKIFTQLLAIDTARTSFGIESKEGRIESEGTYVTLNTETVGEKTAKVEVVAKTGRGTPLETCVGEGTTATITYNVIKSSSSTPINPGTNPENPGTNPENPGTNPENPGTNPENPGTNPENPGTNPENPGTNPENPGTNPENPGTNPENPGTNPENPGTNPENPGTNPENPGTNPENPGTNPENPGTNPENPGTNPENPGTNPENPGTNPENPGTNPENPGTNPDVDVIDTATLGYKVGEEILTGVCTKTPVNEFKNILLKGKVYNVIVKTADKKVVTEGNITTGMFVEIQDANGRTLKDKDGHLVVYEIAVKGDVNGDGVANSLDSMLIKAYRNEVTRLSSAEIAAADINEDGTVNVADSKLVLYHRAEVAGYSLDFKK